MLSSSGSFFVCSWPLVGRYGFSEVRGFGSFFVMVGAFSCVLSFWNTGGLAFFVDFCSFFGMEFCSSLGLWMFGGSWRVFSNWFCWFFSWPGFWEGFCSGSFIWAWTFCDGICWDGAGFGYLVGGMDLVFGLEGAEIVFGSGMTWGFSICFGGRLEELDCSRRSEIFSEETSLIL